MSHPLARCCLVAALLGGALGLAPAGGGAGADDEAAPADPLPLRRVQIPPGRVAAELERARQGMLLQLPRDEFEAKLRRVRRAADALKKPPRLALARYRARLQGNALVGRGDWTVFNSSPRPAVWAIPDLNLALSEVRLPAGEAVLGDLDGKSPGLLVPREGKQEVFFDWSLRGLAGARGLLFDLRVPACAVASLELTLPADHAVSVSRTAGLLLGPFPAEERDFRVWRLHFAGRAQVDLTVRKADPAGGEEAGLVLWQLDARQSLAPDRVEAEFEFQIEALHRGVRELVFACDPRLRPHAVEGRGLEVEGWGLRDAKDAGPDGARLLAVKLHEPVLGPLPALRVRCLAPLEAGPFWKSPGMALRGAVPRGETLTVRVPASVQAENWQAGRYRLLKSSTKADGTQEVVWQGPGGADAAARPGARVLTEGAALRTRERTWWQVGPRSSQLTAEITYEVIRGRVFHLPVRLPRGWQVEAVDLAPGQAPVQWYPIEEHGETLLRVDLQQALTPSQPARLTVRLRDGPPAAAPRPGRVALDFPHVRPLHPGPHEGALAVSVDPYYEAQGPPGAAAPERDGPWGAQAPTFYYPYRGEPPAGRIVLRTHPPRLLARCASEVVLSSGRAAQVVRLRVEAESGTPDTLDLHLSAPAGAFAGWKTDHPFNAVRRVERLVALEIAPTLLAALTPPAPNLPAGAVAVATAAALPPGGQRWRLTLARPLQEHEPLTLETTLEQDLRPAPRAAPAEWAAAVAALAGPPLAALPLLPGALRRPADGATWDVPLITLPGAARLDGEVTLFLTGAESLRVEARGLQEYAPAGAGPAPAPGPAPWRTFHYGRGGPGEPAPRLIVSGDPVPAGRRAEEACDFARLVTEVEPHGRLLHRLDFRVSRWGRRSLQVRLPAGSHLLTVRTEGRWVDQVPRRETPQGVELDLPVSAGAEHQAFEIAYARPRHLGPFGDALEAPLPQFPVAPVAVRRVWRLPPDLTPLYPGQFRRLAEGRSAAAGGLFWDEWEPVAGPGPQDRLEVVWRPAVPVLGLLLAGALLLAAAALRRVPAGWKVSLLLAWVGAAGLAYMWLPAPLSGLAAWPALAGLGVAFWAYAGPRPQPTFARASTRSTPRPLPAAVVLLLAGAWFLQAGAGDAYPVLILPDVPAPGKQSVLIPGELWKRLGEMEARGSAEPGGAVLLAARYDGKVGGANVDFEAQFQIYSFAERATLTLPLTGVELNEGALLQGADAFPVPLPAPLAGYSVPVTGKGLQKLELRFRARAAATADGREVRIGIPRLAQSRLRLTLPAAAQAPQAVTALGAQAVAALPGGQQQLQADLGRDAALQVRWRLPGGAARQPSLKVQEAYLWQVRPGGDGLTGVLDYAITGGEVSRLALAVPAELAVQSVEVGPVRDRPGADEAPPRLKGWRLLPAAAGQKTRRLEVDLQAPATAGLQVTLGLLPRAPLTGNDILLPLPAPLGAQPARGLLAYRVQGAEAGQQQQQLGVTSVPDDSFADAWRKGGMGDPGPLTRAYSFRRAPGGDGVAGLRLTLRPSAYQAAAEVTWRVRHRQADLKAVVQVKAPAAEVSLLEAEVPAAVRLTRVGGTAVHGWSRAGPRVQIWLKEPTRQATLHLEGWVPLAEPAADGREGRFDLPAWRFLNADAAAALVQVTADPDLALELTQSRNLTPAPLPLPVLEHLPAKILTYVTEPGPYEGQFRVRASPVLILARSLTQVERRAGRLEFASLVRCEIPHGELRHLAVEVTGGPAEGLRVEAPRALVVPVKDPKRRAWTVTPLPGATRSYEFHVRGRLPAGAAVPEVRVRGAVPKERWLAVVGDEARPLEARGLRAVKDPAEALRDWPAEADQARRFGAVWQVTADDWRLRLRPAAPADDPPVRVLLQERAVAVADGRHWLHEAVYLLYARRGAGLRLALPTGAEVVGVDLDGLPAAPRQPAPGRLWLPLAEGTGPHRVRLRWKYGPGEEDFARPRGDDPRLEEAAADSGTTRLWTVDVPEGYHLRPAPGSGRLPDPASAAVLELYRADALFRLSKLLAERSPRADDGPPDEALLVAQRDFYARCRRAEAAPGPRDGDAPSKGPSGQSAAEWLKQLRRDNRLLAKAQGFERLRARAERAGDEHEPPDAGPRGHAVSWPAGELPRFALESRAEEEHRDSWASTLLLLGALLAVGLLSRSPGVCALGRALWPELLALLGAAAWLLLGLPLFVLPALAGVGVLARLWVAARWLGRLQPRPRPAPSTGT